MSALFDSSPQWPSCFAAPPSCSYAAVRVGVLGYEWGPRSRGKPDHTPAGDVPVAAGLALEMGRPRRGDGDHAGPDRSPHGWGSRVGERLPPNLQRTLLCRCANSVTARASRGWQSKSRPRSDDGDLAALRRVAFQRLLDHAQDAEIRIRPFLDQDEMAFSAADAGRPVFLGRQLGGHRAQVSENTHRCFLQTLPPRQRLHRESSRRLWQSAGRPATASRRFRVTSLNPGMSRGRPASRSDDLSIAASYDVPPWLAALHGKTALPQEIGRPDANGPAGEGE